MTTATTDTAPISCYLLDDPPRSAGRMLLSRVLEEFVAIEWGIGPDDLAEHFGPGTLAGEDARQVSDWIRSACRAIVDLALAERLQTYARPLGGGLPVEIDPSLWEIDDPRARFATSAIALKAPFDSLAPPTHWIFADAGDVAEMTTRLCGGPLPHPSPDAAFAEDFPDDEAAVTAQGKFLRIAEVAARTGMSRSTIYVKIERGEFPEPVRLGSRFSRWREAAVEGWIRQPR